MQHNLMSLCVTCARNRRALDKRLHEDSGTTPPHALPDLHKSGEGSIALLLSSWRAVFGGVRPSWDATAIAWDGPHGKDSMMTASLA